MKALRPDSLQQLTGCLTRLPVGCQHLSDGGGMRLRRGCKHFFNCTRDAHKGDTAFEKCFDRDLVGGVEGDAVCAADFGCFEGQSQAGEALEVGRLELQVAQGGQIEGERTGWASRRRGGRPQ